ncbi:MAG: hypothetical protein JW915_17555 [Chitinispirillaceae bacterium]|nr:hypothetical protein [Chitinispirillaceae bacterium]
MDINDSASNRNVSSVKKSMDCMDWMLDEQKFAGTLLVEKSRAIRNSRTVGIAKVNLKDSYNNSNVKRKCVLESLRKSVITLRGKIRDGDSIGWIKNSEEIGVLFTDIKADDQMVLQKKLVDCFYNEGMLSLSLNLVNFSDDTNRDKNIGELLFNDLLKKKMY